MDTLTARDVYERYVTQLRTSERRKLVEMMLQKTGSGDQPKWTELAGKQHGLSPGDDAQERVSRTRREAEEERSRPL
jgi:hypothetical protein